jgi:hypothetical protein
MLVFVQALSRFEERDGGFYVDDEVIALSRDLPAANRWLAEPIVRRVSRDSLVAALRQTGEATHSAGRSAHRAAVTRSLTE